MSSLESCGIISPGEDYCLHEGEVLSAILLEPRQRNGKRESKSSVEDVDWNIEFEE